MSTEGQENGAAKLGKKYMLGLLAAAVIIIAVVAYAYFETSKPAMSAAVVTVYKTPTCGCCGDWIEHLRRNGLEVNAVDVDSTQSYRADAGVPNRLGSCHTAVVGDYFIEGHVPADLVQGLIDMQPDDIRGLTVPGMPLGSPGMEGPNPVEYEVLAVDKDGEVFVYATRQGSSEPQ